MTGNLCFVFVCLFKSDMYTGLSSTYKRCWIEPDGAQAVSVLLCGVSQLSQCCCTHAVHYNVGLAVGHVQYSISLALQRVRYFLVSACAVQCIAALHRNACAVLLIDALPAVLLSPPLSSGGHQASGVVKQE